MAHQARSFIPDTLQGWLTCAQAILTIVALVLGGIWFWRRRRLYPKAVLSHRIEAEPLGDQHVFVRVTAVFKNTGDVRILVGTGCTRICGVPRPGEDVSHLLNTNGRLALDDWARAKFVCIQKAELHCAEPFEVEPTETDEFAFDFALPATPLTVVVQTDIRNESKRKRGEMSWTVETVYSVPEFPTNRKGENQAMRKTTRPPSRKERTRPPKHEEKQQPARPTYTPPETPAGNPNPQPGSKRK